MLKDLKLSYQKKNTQFILANNKGKVIESDSVLFKLQTASLISDIHPFFLNINTSIESKFTCVHLDINDITLICDIEIKPIANHTLIILSDFSEHYNSFQSLAQSRNESAIASEMVQINNQLLIEKQEFKNKFIANFSHEIISPIMSIMTFANVLNNTKLTQEQREYINVINNSSYHLKTMVNDVLDLSKIETNNLDIVNKRFSLKKLTKTIATEYKFKCKQKGLNFIIDYDEQMPNYIVSDKTRIHQVLKNLLDNALKFTQKGEISIKIEQLYRRARQLTFSIQIKDTGSGIAKADQDLIFERFSRLDNATQIHGAGLGLTIVKEIVALINGNITIESQQNKGTTFTLNIKAKTPLKDINLKRNKEEKQDLSANYKILLVENNITDQLSIFKILANNKAFYLDIANSGQEAINLVNNNSYDLVLMDYNMPKLDGIKTSKALKKIANNLSIILITGSYINDELSQYKDVYYEAILNKPFDEETLINSIYMCLK